MTNAHRDICLRCFLKHTNGCNFDMNTEFKMTHLMVGEHSLLHCLVFLGVSLWYGQDP